MNKRKTIVPGFDSLLEMLASRDGQMRQKARKSLVRLGKPVVNPLIKALKKSNQIQIRWEVVKVLGDIGDVECIPQLVKALEDGDTDVSWLAAEELSRFKKEAWYLILNALINDKSYGEALRSGAHHVFFKQKSKGYNDLLEKLNKALEPDSIRKPTKVVAHAILKRMKTKT
jgi:HEAT repeat protein